MIRGLTDLLDEWMPIIAGSEINDDPYNPVSKYAIDLVNEKKMQRLLSGCTGAKGLEKSSQLLTLQ